MTPERERLERVLGGEPLTALRARLRRRFALGRAAQELSLSGLTAQERGALEGLLGLRAREASSLRLSLPEIDAVLARAGLASSLREALEILDGPIPDLVTERQRREQSWGAVFASVSAPALRRLLENSSGRGLLKRLARSRAEIAHATLDAATRVLARLPAAGIPRSQLAAEVLGDAHGLDCGRAVTSLLMAALRNEDESERETWARVGVLVNELASPVLMLNLSAAEDSPLGQLIATSREHGLPLHVSLRNLLQSAPRWRVRDQDIFVCENANVVAIAADRLGSTCAPLVCTDGMPSASQRTLLRQLADHGARLHYHGDFDWPGLRIANFVLRTFDARPWRLDITDYQGRSGRALKGPQADASWAPALSRAMTDAGYVLEEEAVANELCEDLAKGGR